MNKGFITTIILVIAGMGILGGLFGYLYTLQDNKVGAFTLVVPQGGTGASSFSKYPIVGAGSTGALTASSTLWIAGINATSTTASSTFQGSVAEQFRVVGGFLQDTFATCSGTANKVVYSTVSGKFSCATDETGATGVSIDWQKELNYGVLNLTPTTTIPIWAKDAIYASSTLIVQGNTTLSQATSTNLYSTTLGLNSEYFTDLTGTGLQNTAGVLTLNATGDWTGTIDSNNFAGGAIGAGDLLYGSGVGNIAELGIGTNGNILAISNGLPAWIASSTMPFAASGANSDITSLSGLTTALTVAQGGTGAITHTIGNLLVGATTGAITSTTTANLKASLLLNLVENTALSTWAGSANLTTTGTLTSGGLGNNFTILNGAAPTVDAAGEIAIDTTSDQLIYYGTSKRVLVGNLYPAFTYSTSTAWTGSTTIPLGTAFVAETWNQVQCYTDVGTAYVLFSDGTNLMQALQASTTVGTFTFTSNNTFTAAEKRQVQIGNPATAPTKVSCTVSKSVTAD